MDHHCLIFLDHHQYPQTRIVSSCPNPILFFARFVFWCHVYWEGMTWDGIHHLIERAKAGDDDAWQSLHEMVRPYLLNFGQRLLRPASPHESVSDLTQSTWLCVLTGIDGFRGGEDDTQTGPLFRAWLRKTMTNLN